MLKNWFDTLKTSVTKPKEYRKLSERKFWSGYWYLFLLILLGVFIKVAVFSVATIQLTPSVEKKLPEVKQTMKQAYPSELVVDVRNGTATTNVQEPYVISLSNIVPKLTDGEKTSFLVIDTNSSVENYPQYKSLFLLTKNNLVFPSSNNSSASSYEVFPLSDLKDPITIDKLLYDNIIAQILPLVDKVPQFMYGFAIFALVMFPILGSFAVLNGSLFYLLVLTLLLLVVAKVMKKSFTYKTLFKASMYGLTMPLVITYVADLLKLQIPGLYNIVFLGWMICVLTLSASPVYTKINARSKKVSSR